MKTWRIRRACVGVLALVAPMAAGGCVALAVGAAAGVGTVAYVKGELKSTEEIPLDRAWNATVATIEELEFTTRTMRKDALQGRLVARRADGSDVTIRLDADGSNLTKIGIRVGTFGDEALSRTMLEKIKTKAGA